MVIPLLQAFSHCVTDVPRPTDRYRVGVKPVGRALVEKLPLISRIRTAWPGGYRRASNGKSTECSAHADQANEDAGQRRKNESAPWR